MKTSHNHIFLLLFFIFTLVGCATLQDNRVAPPEIEMGFMKKYPNNNVVEWKWDQKLVAYKGLFYVRDKKYHAYFNAFGKWLNTDRDLDVDELPADIIWELNNTHISNWKIQNVIEQESNKHDLVYLIDVQAPSSRRRGGQKLLLYFLPDGTVADIERER